MSTRFSLRFAILPVAVAALLSSGCENTATLPTPEDQSPGLAVYPGTLEPGARIDYVISLDSATTVQVMVAGAVAEDPLRTISPLLGVHIGFWDTVACTDMDATEQVPRFTAALQRYLTAGSYCVSVSDLKGGLTQRVATVTRIVAPVLLNTGGLPGTVVFASALTPKGRATRTIDASRPGTIEITLEGLSPSNAEVGLGLGLQDAEIGCQIAHVVTTRPGSSPQITEQVDPGAYCVSVFDMGTLTATQNFSVRIKHP